jgi:hypothetical protein
MKPTDLSVINVFVFLPGCGDRVGMKPPDSPLPGVMTYAIV